MGKLETKELETWVNQFSSGTPEAKVALIKTVTAEVVAAMGRGRQMDTRQFKGFVSAHELQTKGFPPMRWAVPGLIPEGLTILAGRPKAGKSVLALNIAFDIAMGQPVLGSIAADQGEVFMYSLEDPEQRMQRRLKAMSEVSGCPEAPWPEKLYMSREAPLIAAKGGLLSDLKELAWAYPKTRLIIIDHMSLVLPEDTPGKRRYAEDIKALRPVQQWAVEQRIAVLFLTHCRKPNAKGETDPLDEVIESTGRTAAADTVLVLKRKTNNTDTLAIRSKDVEGDEVNLTYDAEHYRFTMEVGAILTEWMRPIYDLLNEHPDGLYPKDIAEKLNVPGATIRKQLGRMVEAGILDNLPDGRYTIRGKRDKKTAA